MVAAILKLVSASGVVTPVDSKHERNDRASVVFAGSRSLLGAGGLQVHVPTAPAPVSLKFGFAFMFASAPTGGFSTACGEASASKFTAPMSVSKPISFPITTFTTTVVVPDGNTQASSITAGVEMSQSIARYPVPSGAVKA
jgi:hypothetical protein